MSLRTALLAASLAATPVMAQTDKSLATAATDKVDANNTALTKEGKELWTCATKAVDSVMLGETTASEGFEQGQHVYTRTKVSAGINYGATNGAAAILDKKGETVNFISYVIKAEDAIAGPPLTGVSVKVSFSKEAKFVDTDILGTPDSPIKGTYDLVKTQGQLAMVTFMACTNEI